MLEQITSSEILKYLAGLAGGILSLRYADENTNRLERLAMTLTGFFTAVFCTPAVQTWLSLSTDYSYGISFLLGLYGWAITGGVMKILKSKELKDILLSKFK
jgi:hypothetical protein